MRLWLGRSIAVTHGRQKEGVPLLIGYPSQNLRRVPTDENLKMFRATSIAIWCPLPGRSGPVARQKILSCWHKYLDESPPHEMEVKAISKACFITGFPTDKIVYQQIRGAPRVSSHNFEVSKSSTLSSTLGSRESKRAEAHRIALGADPARAFSLATARRRPVIRANGSCSFVRTKNII